MLILESPARQQDSIHDHRECSNILLVNYGKMTDDFWIVTLEWLLSYSWVLGPGTIDAAQGTHRTKSQYIVYCHRSRVKPSCLGRQDGGDKIKDTLVIDTRFKYIVYCVLHDYIFC